jgi:acylphosphatase
VQGVGFRAFVYRRALSLGVTGWVRNRSDGSVELTAEGSPNLLEALLDDVRRGPPLSGVDTVKESWQPATGEYRGFGVR